MEVNLFRVITVIQKLINQIRYLCIWVLKKEMFFKCNEKLQKNSVKMVIFGVDEIFIKHKKYSYTDLKKV